MRSALTTAYLGLLAIFVAGVFVQVFLAGLGIFGAESFDAHETAGWILHTLLIVTVLLAVAGPRTRVQILGSIGLLVLVTVQIALVEARDDTPGLAALHPLLAVVALLGAMHMLTNLRRHRATATATAAAGPATPTTTTP